MSKQRLVPSLLLLTLLLSGPTASRAFAAEGNTAVTKLGRGLINIVTGWVEIPIQISERESDESVPIKVFHGAVFGVVRATQRMAYGIWDTATFLFPPYDTEWMDPDTLITPQPPKSSTHRVNDF